MPETTTNPVTIELLILLIARYAENVAFVAEEKPATDVQDFIHQLTVTADRLEEVRLDENSLTASAATYLAAAVSADAADQQMLLKFAEEDLCEVAPRIDEYRDMV